MTANPAEMLPRPHGTGHTGGVGTPGGLGVWGQQHWKNQAEMATIEPQGKKHV